MAWRLLFVALMALAGLTPSGVVAQGEAPAFGGGTELFTSGSSLADPAAREPWPALRS